MIRKNKIGNRIACLIMSVVLALTPCTTIMATTLDEDIDNSISEITNENTDNLVPEDSDVVTVDEITQAEEPVQEETAVLEDAQVQTEESMQLDNAMLSVQNSGTVYVINGKKYDISDYNSFRSESRDGLTAYYNWKEYVCIVTGTYTGTVPLYIWSYAPQNTTKYLYCDFSMGNCKTMAGFFSLDPAANKVVNEIYFGENFDSSGVENMSRMFSDCTELTTIEFGNNFSTQSAKNMNCMFRHCEKLSYMDMSCFDTSNVTDMSSMFFYSNYVPDLSNFDTHNVTSMRQMFSYCQNTVELDLSSFDMTNVTDAYNFMTYSWGISRVYTPKHLSASFDKDTDGVGFYGEFYEYNNSTPYTSLPAEMDESIFLKKGLNDNPEDNKYYTPTPAQEKQSFWNLDEDGKLKSYTRDRALLRNGVYNLAYYDEDSGDIWFGSWRFDSSGNVMVGDIDGRHYNDVVGNAYPYGIDLYEVEQQQREMRPSDYFLSYNYLEKYMDDLDTLCTVELSVLNFTKEFCAIVSGCFKSWSRAEFDIDKVVDEIAYQYMNDEVRCKDVLKKILEKRYDPSNAVTDFNDQTKRNLKPFKTTIDKITTPLKEQISDKMKEDKKLLAEGKIDKSKYKEDYLKVISESKENELAFDGMIVGRFIGSTMTVLSDANDLLLAFADYTDVNNFLDEVMEIAPAHGPLKQAAYDLKFEYNTKFFYTFVNGIFDAVDEIDGWSKLLNGVGVIPSIPSFNMTGFVEQDLEKTFINIIDFAYGTKFKTIQAVFDMIRTQDKRFDATENIVTSVTMRYNAIEALKKMEEKALLDGNVCAKPEDFSKYADMFYLAKGLTLYQYEQMQVFYNSPNMKSRLKNECREFVDEFLGSEIDKINTMTLDSYDVPASKNDVSEFIFDKDGHTAYMLQGNLLKNTWKKISGKMYYFNDEGYAETGFCDFDSSMNLYTGSDACAPYRFYFSEGDMSCNADKARQGSLVYGLQTLDDGNTYYFDEQTGIMQKNCTITFIGKYAVIDKNGHCDVRSGIPQTPGTLPSALEVRENKIVHKINCPVDVAAYDGSGAKIAEIVNNKVVLVGNNSIKAAVDDDGQKIIVADKSVVCNLKITANADGKCSYSITSYDAEGQFEGKTEYNEIEIIKNNVISSNMTIVPTSEEGTNAEYYTVEKDELILADEYVSALSYHTVRVDYGSGIIEKIVEKGDFIEIALEEGQYPTNFRGWFIGTEKVSSEKSFRMQVNENIEIRASSSEYAITYRSNTEDEESFIQDINPDVGVTAQNNRFYRDNYVFSGWNTQPDGYGTAYNEGDIIADCYDGMELYAQWAPLPRIDSFSLSIMSGKIGLNCYIYGIPQTFERGGMVKFGDNEIALSNRQYDGTYRFSYTCAAKNMGDHYLVRLYDCNGQLIRFANSNDESGGYKYSVRDYIDSVKDRQDELGQLARAMDTYGLCAQKYFKHNVPASVPEVETADFSEFQKEVAGELPKGVSYFGSSLVLGDNISIRHYFNIEGNPSVYKWRMDGVEVTPKEYNGMYYFEKQNISMRLLYSYDSRTVLQLVSPKSWSVTYSPFSYAYDAMSKSNNTDLINLLNSMYWYGRAVYDYRAY